MSAIDDIRRQLAASRSSLLVDCKQLQADLDFVGKTRRSIVAKPIPWLSGAALTGWFLAGRKKARKKAKIRRRKREEEVEAVKRKLPILGVLLALFKILLPVLRPMATAYATKRLAGLVKSRF